MVDSVLDQEHKEAPLEGEHMRKENYGLVIRVTWELFKVPIKILELVRQITWSKGNMYASKVDLYQDDGTAQGSKEESKDRVFPYLSRCLPNLEDEIHLKGGRIVTP